VGEHDDGLGASEFAGKFQAADYVSVDEVASNAGHEDRTKALIKNEF
jgi:hypothetical protein